MEAALETIIRTYVTEELHGENPPEDVQDATGEVENGEINHNLQNAEKPFNQVLHNGNNYVQVLHDCLEKKGIMRELQAFLRHKLVLILQEKWPTTITQQSEVELIHPVVIKLIQDFLCSRKLLYSLSVLSGELGLSESSRKSKFGKMKCSSAENLLEELGITKDSSLSEVIIKSYADRSDSSLLECIIQFGGWTASGGMAILDTNAEERLIMMTTRVDEVKLQLDKSRKMGNVDKFYNQRKESLKGNLGAEERLLAIQRELEKDKEIQIQMAKDKFRAEEEHRIRGELRRKFEFDMVKKENELLLNYKERAERLRGTLEREKSVWLKEKCQQEQALLDREKELQALMDQVVKKKENLETLSFRETFSERATVGNSRNPRGHPGDHDSARNSDDLKLTIKRLQEENSKLKSVRNYIQDPPERDSSEDSPRSSRPTTKKRSTNYSSQMDSDKMAFLQYTLEQQAQELKRLNEYIFLNQNKDSSPHFQKKNLKVKESVSGDLLAFLSESKRRCEDIEKESRNLDQKVYEIQTRRSRSYSPSIFGYNNAHSSDNNPSLAIPSTPYSTIMPQLIAEQMQILKRPTIVKPLGQQHSQSFSHFSTPNNRFANTPEPMKARHHDTLSKNQTTKPKAKLGQHQHQQQMGRSSSFMRFSMQQILDEGLEMQEELENSQEQNQQVKANVQRRLSNDENGNEYDSPRSFKNGNDTPKSISQHEINISELRRRASTAELSRGGKLAKAVKRGALSFEKVTSSDDDSSFRQDSGRLLSARNSRSHVSFNEENENTSEVRNGNNENGRKNEKYANEQLDEHEEHEEHEEPVKLNGSESVAAIDEDKSLSVSYSAPHDSLADQDSDFWKM